MKGLFWRDFVGLCFAFGSQITMVIVPLFEFVHIEV